MKLQKDRKTFTYKRRGYMEKLLCPSMMCADFASLKTEIEKSRKRWNRYLSLRCDGWKLRTKLWNGITRYRIYL